MELNKMMKNRLFFMLSVFAIILILLVTRVGYLQIAKGEELKVGALSQQTKDSLVSPKRGTIYDTNGKVLAMSASVETVYVHPAQIKEDKGAELVAAKLAEILEMEYDDVYAKITKQVSYNIIKKKIENGAADKIRELKVADDTKKYFQGVGLSEDSKRYYPLNNLASHVIGFTGTDNQGLDGVEAVYDEILRGTPGKVSALKNVKGTVMNEKHEEQTEPKNGNNLVLTIDETVQHFLENHLQTAKADNKLGNGATGIIMDVKTGGIIAMSTVDTFDLNNPFMLNNAEIAAQIEELPKEGRNAAKSKELSKMWRNKAISDTYEPGSTFKIITSSIALEEKVVTLQDQFNCTGSFRVGGHNIRCWKSGGHGAQTFLKGVQNSCNPVFMQVGARIGPDLFKKYFDAFGFAQTTGIDLPGEAIGLFYPEGSFNEVEIATTSFGQGFQITPLQLITAVSAVANGGYMMEPHVVKEIRDENNNIIEQVQPKVLRQVISEETSEIMCSVLESVVTEGSASKAKVLGFRMAGKTGTSEKFPRSAKKKIASFIGFAPANDPQIACLILLDEPNGDLYYGGQIAAPVVQKIMDDTLNYLDIEKQYTKEEIESMNKSMPDVTAMTVADAKTKIKDFGFTVKVVGEGEKVTSQMPNSGAILSQNSTVILYTDGQELQKSVELPDVVGQTYKQAKNELKAIGLNINSAGISEQVNDNDIIISQYPKAGELVYAAEVIEVETAGADAH